MGKRWLKRLAILVLLMVGILGGLLLWAAGGRQSPGEFQGKITDHGGGAVPRASGKQLRVMTWNIAYARGTNPDNDQNDVAPKAEIEKRLREMGALIRRYKADIVLLQEVDFDCRRSRYLDQLALLSRHSGLRYAARAVSWKANWVPHPLWPPSKQYGPVVSGGGVLSRFPISENRIVLHPKPDENDPIYNMFYLFRYTQLVKIARGDVQIRVVNNHLEAFKKKNRAQQAAAVAKLVAPLVQKKDAFWLLGGDLNTAPPEATKKHGFVDSAEDDYRDDLTLPTIRNIAGLSEIVPVARYREQEAAHFTFPTMKPTRRLDYLFFDQRLTLDRYEIVDTKAFSDHKPVLAVFVLP
jgi:endonuclease/exonuclease/phosphatase family metal-dependent hydrolase